MDEFGGDDLDAALCEFDMDGFVEQALTQPDAGAPGPIQPLLSQPLSQQQPRPCVPVGCNVPPPAAAWVAPPPAAAGVCPVLQPQPATPSQPEPGAPAAGGPPAASVDDAQRLALEATLRACFGFGSFRDKQLEVIAAVTFGRRDVACFWATGAGKSLVYQLPALHTSRTAIVVSPLISLMSDQVRKMNATVGASRGRDLACFLGSAQADSSVEQRAFAGEYAVVYVTPEKVLDCFWTNSPCPARETLRATLTRVCVRVCSLVGGGAYGPTAPARRATLACARDCAPAGVLRASLRDVWPKAHSRPRAVPLLCPFPAPFLS